MGIIVNRGVATFCALEGMDDDLRHWQQQTMAPCSIEVQSRGLSSFTVNGKLVLMLLFGRIAL